jgi:ABC-type Zn uptake system ZnuABC Zn-binding protein ZnuA
LIAPIVASLVTASTAPAATLAIVTTSEDLASLAREVGGDRIEAEVLTPTCQYPHVVEPKPSFIPKLHRADLLILVGCELEAGWLPPLVQRSRNAQIQPGARGYLDASLTARILEIPTGNTTRAMADHAVGHPFYWLDPANGRRIAQAILTRLIEISPSDADYFNQRYLGFDRRLREAENRWDTTMARYRGVKVVTYHRSWPNFAERFGLDVVGYVEPHPGIPPSAAHTVDLIQQMRRQDVRLLLVEPYLDLRTPNAIARETGAVVVVMVPSVGEAT